MVDINYNDILCLWLLKMKYFLVQKWLLKKKHLNKKFEKT